MEHDAADSDGRRPRMEDRNVAHIDGDVQTSCSFLPQMTTDVAGNTMMTSRRSRCVQLCDQVAHRRAGQAVSGMEASFAIQYGRSWTNG